MADQLSKMATTNIGSSLCLDLVSNPCGRFSHHGAEYFIPCIRKDLAVGEIPSSIFSTGTSSITRLWLIWYSVIMPLRYPAGSSSHFTRILLSCGSKVKVTGLRGTINRKRTYHQ